MRHRDGGRSEYNSPKSKQKKNYSSTFKAQVAMELLRGAKTLNELAEQYQIAPATLSAWHRVFQERAQTVFQQGPTAQDKEITRQNAEIEALQKKVGQLTIECDWLKKNLTNSLAPTERTALVSLSERQICVKRQCELAGANRSSVYRCAKEEGKQLSHGKNEANLTLKRQLDELYMKYPAWGYRKMTSCLRNNGEPRLNGKRVRRLLRTMGIAALYPKSNLSKRLHAEHVRPYLLKRLMFDRVDQVWGLISRIFR